MMMIQKVIIVSLFYANILSAQIDSSLDYFPFHTGDTWQYKTYQGYHTVVVGNDSLMPNLKIYRHMSRIETIDGFYRIDTATACVYRYDEIMTDSLRARSGDKWKYILCDSIYYDTIFNVVTSVKVLSEPTALLGNPHYFYAKGFGLVYFSFQDEGPYMLPITYESKLIYAKINGQEYGTMVSVNRKDNSLPKDLLLEQNYPNPFNPSTTIPFTTPPNPSPYKGEGKREGFVTLKIYDILGREVATIVNEKLPAGMHTRQWDASGFQSGVYFYRLSANGFTQTKKLLLIK